MANRSRRPEARAEGTSGVTSGGTSGVSGAPPMGGAAAVVIGDAATSDSSPELGAAGNADMDSGDSEVDAGAAGSSAGSAGESAGSANMGSGGAPAVVEPTCSAQGSPAPAGLYLPCAVSAAMSVCRTCHSDPPVMTVAHAFVSFAQVKASAAAIHDVVKSGYMPWPPYQLSDDDRSTLLFWLGADGSCAVGVSTACR